jgi:hypothetical protein
VILPAVQDVDEDGNRVAAARQRGAGDHVERDPQAPWIAIVQRRRLTEAEEHAPQDGDDAERGDDTDDRRGLVDERAADGCRLGANRARLYAHGLSSPVVGRSPARRFRITTVASTP